MKKSIFEKKMDNPRFRVVYEDVSRKLSLGEEIAELRHSHKMTQAELARKVRTSRTAIARYESGRYENFSLSTLKRIAKAFHRKLDISFS
jgi:transcriptional regulator with XRE-family HTH domain